MRAEPYRESLRAVRTLFGDQAKDLVFLGSCVLGLYSRPSGGAFRSTIDADAASTVMPWSTQEKRLADMCSSGLLLPDPEIACRYHLVGKNIAVDVLSPEGKNVGNVTDWFRRAIARASDFDLGGGAMIRAVTPPYFLALKLEAWADRGRDPMTDKDAEDIVAVATEVLDLPEQIHAEGIAPGIAALWSAALMRHDLTTDDLSELVTYHLHPNDAAEEDRVLTSLRCSANGA